MTLFYLWHFERAISRVGSKVMSFASSSPLPMQLPQRRAGDDVCEQAVKAIH